MGILEEKQNKKRKREHLQHVVLATVKTAGLLCVGLLAPNVLGALTKLGFIKKQRQEEYVTSSASKLVGRGLLKFEHGHYALTQSGEKILRKWELSNYSIKSHKKWDKKWRIIIFDIPEKKKGVRRQISVLFNQAGLYRLQDSVWVYPYDCEDIIGLLKTDYGVGKELLYIIAEEIENDRFLRSAFGFTNLP